MSDEEARNKASELKPLPKIKSNKKLLAYVRREMVKMHEKALLEKKRAAAAEAAAGGEEHDFGSSDSGSSDSEDDDDPNVALAKAQEGEEIARTDLV